MSLLGDNKLVHALESVNNLSPMLHDLVDELKSMRTTLGETNAELRAMKVELEAVKGSMTGAADEVSGAATRMGQIADRILPPE